MTRTRRLSLVLALNLALVVGLVVVGLTAHSLGVLAAGADYLADAAAIGVSLLAISLSTSSPSPRHPLGFPKATAVAACVNGGWLLILSLLVIAGAVDRLATGAPHVDGLRVLVVSAVASIAMVIGAIVLARDVDDDDGDGGGNLNMRVVLLDTAADAAAAGGVAVTGGVILATNGFYWLDPTVALLIAMVVGYHALVLLRDVMRTIRRPAVHRVRAADEKPRPH
jgi:cobalt-zinc-cadmium efflux system protein